MKTSKFQQRLLNTINLHPYDEEGEEEEEEEDVSAEEEEDHPTDQQPGPVPASHERTPPAAHKTPIPYVRLQAPLVVAPRVPPAAKPLPSAVSHHPRRPCSASSPGPPPIKRQRIEGLPTPAPATGARPPPPLHAAPPRQALPFSTPPRAAMPAPFHPPASGTLPAPPSTASNAGAVTNPFRDPRLRLPCMTDLPPTTIEAGCSTSLLDLPQSVTVIQDHPCRHVLLSGVDGRTEADRNSLQSKCQNALVPDLIWNEFYTRRGEWKGEWALLCCESDAKAEELKDKLQGTKMARRTLRASFMAHIDVLRREKGPSDTLILFNVPLEYSLDELKRLINATRVHRMSLGRPSRQAEKGAIRKPLEVIATFISPEEATRARGHNGDIRLSTGHVVHASYYPLLEP